MLEALSGLEFYLLVFHSIEDFMRVFFNFGSGFPSPLFVQTKACDFELGRFSCFLGCRYARPAAGTTRNLLSIDHNLTRFKL